MAVNVVIDMLKNNMNAVCENGNAKRHCWRKRRYAGFTVAEMLIIVAIIGVLAGVSFVAVQNYQKSTTQLQYDAIAKEIFVAAQNHLTLAKSENYQDTDTLHTRGTQGNADADVKSGEGGTTVYNDDVYYFSNTDFTSDGSSILDQMLPFGSIELVTGGNFIIRYQPKAAKVLDVFYWMDKEQDRKYGISSVDYKKAVDGYRDKFNEAGEITSSKKRDRSNYEGGGGILGWCGGEEIVASGVFLNTPTIEVINAERLLVKVTDLNIASDDSTITALNPRLKLFVEGRTSGAVAFIQLTQTVDANGTSGKLVEPDLDGTFSRLSDVDAAEDKTDVTYTIVLDDITTPGLHFSQLNSGSAGVISDDALSIKYDPNKNPFIPGENIDIYAVAYSNKELTNVAYSGKWTTNSLFEEVTGTDTLAETAYIGNIRHLENLNDGFSGVAYTDSYFGNSIKAAQTTDLIWKDDDSTTKDFVTTIKTDKGKEQNKTISSINVYDGSAKATKADCFMPVSVTNGTLNYDGRSEYTEADVTKAENHCITGVMVDNTDVTGDTYVEITNGGVFGSLTGGAINNLMLVDTSVTLTSGNAGALVGTLTQSGALPKDDASKDIPNVSNVVAYNTKKDVTATINTAGDAGGLIGKVTGEHAAIEKSAAALVVNSTGEGKAAGGLIGSMTGGSVSGCYSGGHTVDKTVTKKVGEKDVSEVIGVIYDSANYNVTGAGTVGGLIGDAGGATVSCSYSTCSATGNKVGGLVGNTSGVISKCYSTGLVLGTGTNPVSAAFAVMADGATATDCKYYEIINELAIIKRGDSAKDMTVQMDKVVTGDTIQSIEYMVPAVKSDGTAVADTVVISALDASAESYNSFVGAPEEPASGDTPAKILWKAASPYDLTLANYYKVGGASRYNLQTVSKLGATGVVEKTGSTDTTTIEDFVATHHGDWPAPEIFVINTAS